MKKIGILFGQENTYPQAFVDRVNSKKPEDIVAEAVRIDKVIQAETDAYAVIIDRISQDVPFYRAYLKNAALSGTAVINNPFWWTADFVVAQISSRHLRWARVPCRSAAPISGDWPHLVSLALRKSLRC